MVGEVLGRRDYPCLLETLDGGDPHPGYQLGVLPEGTVTDSGAMSGIYDGGEVRVDAGPQELASHPGRDEARLVGVFAPSDPAAAGSGATQGAEAMSPPSWSTATKRGISGFVRMESSWSRHTRDSVCPSLFML